MLSVLPAVNRNGFPLKVQPFEFNLQELEDVKSVNKGSFPNLLSSIEQTRSFTFGFHSSRVRKS